jgi:hypothetical protein
MIFALVALNSSAWAATAPSYSATLIGPTDSDYVYGHAVNSAGAVTGCIEYQAFIQAGSTIRYLGTFGGLAAVATASIPTGR